jgi:hypothetical protein
MHLIYAAREILLWRYSENAATSGMQQTQPVIQQVQEKQLRYCHVLSN